MSDRARRICVLGGGFGGLYTALRLESFDWREVARPEIVLVDSSDRFVFLPLLYEVVSGELRSWEIAPPFTEVLAATRTRFICDRATAVDLEARDIHLQGRPSLRYDYLVLATGVESRQIEVPGLAEWGLEFRTLADAYALDERLRELLASDREFVRVAIIGGGYSGVELAGKIADRLGSRGRLRVVERGDTLLKAATTFNRAAAERALEAREVAIDLETSVAAVTEQAIVLCHREREDEIPVDLVITTAGTQVPDWIRQLPLSQTERGRLTVEPTLRASGREDVFVLGDLADCRDASGQQVPPTAQVAFQQSDFCAWNLWASLSGKPLLPFRYQNLGEMMALGIEDATVTTLGGIEIEGPAAHIMRRLAYLYRMPTMDHQLSVGANWIAQPFLEALAG